MKQFLTPAPVAEQAAGLFTPAVEPVRVLDLGSGTGILAALVAGMHQPAAVSRPSSGMSISPRRPSFDPAGMR